MLDTDVNAAALGECLWGAGKALDSLVYITVGTGIGGGAVIGGRPVHGVNHPEMGHIRIPHDRGADPFDGFVPLPWRLSRRTGVRPRDGSPMGYARRVAA